MKKIIVLAIISLVVFGAISISPLARASMPTLSLNGSGGNSVQVTVSGDPNSSVFLYYPQTNYGMQSQYLGSTNYSGYFSTTLSASQYNINAGNLVYVLVNNQQSQSIAWPYSSNNYNYSGAVTLSQTNVTVSTNQSVNITISGGNPPYSMFQSITNIFQAVISGNTLTITGLNYGSATLNVCSSGIYNGSSGCAVLNVSVGYNNNNNYGSQVTLSPSNITLNSGNSATVTISGSGNYYISNNSNSSIASTYINGNIMTVTGSSTGSSNITVCQNQTYYINGNNNQCATLYVTVNYGNNNYYQTPTLITFSQPNPTISTGQNMSVSISGGDSYNYFISHNSNSSAVQTTLSGSSLNIYGLQNSITVIVVCSSSTSCGALTVTVGYNNNNYNNNNSYNNNGGNWTFCANEKQFCVFSGTHNVRYGANGNYYYRSFTGGVSCSNSTFGDPAFMTVKQCSYQ